MSRRRPRPDDAKATARVIADRCLATRARRLDREVTRAYNEALRPYGITSPQLTVLVNIALLEPVSPGALADRIGLAKSTLTRNVQRMIQVGWVRSDGTAHDRLEDLSLSRKGETLLSEAYEGWVSAQAHAEGRLGGM